MKGRFIGSGSPPNIQISSIKGGFSLSGHFKDAEIPEQISVRVAYEVRSGNPFKKYTPLDFELDKDPIIIRPNGLEIISCRDNHLHLGVMTADFHLAVTGFDRHRDLRIKISARRRQ